MWLTVRCNSVWIKKNQLNVTFVFFISLLLVAQHVSGNHVPIIRSWRLRDVIASCWYVPWLQEGCQVRLAGSASMDALPTNRRNKQYKKWHLVGFSYPHWITMHGQPHIRLVLTVLMASKFLKFRATDLSTRTHMWLSHLFSLRAFRFQGCYN